MEHAAGLECPCVRKARNRVAHTHKIQLHFYRFQLVLDTIEIRIACFHNCHGTSADCVCLGQVDFKQYRLVITAMDGRESVSDSISH